MFISVLLCVCVGDHCVPSAYEGLKLELQMAVSHCVGSGSLVSVLYRSASALNY